MGAFNRNSRLHWAESIGPIERVLLSENAGMSKHIYIYSPSGAVRDKAAFRRGIRRLKSLGHSVEVDSDALSSHMRFAGDDEVRLAAIARAAASGADVALISRGGYGLTRILDRIDFAAVARAIAGGTQFVGISDFTAFQMALLATTKCVSWAGPALCEGFGAEPEPDDIMEDCFNDMLLGQGEGAGWRMPPLGRGANAAPAGVELHIGNATLWGGNLAVLSSLVGTPYLPKISGGILFLEDIAEPPYRVERMLSQLLHAGVLARQKAVVLGQFTDFRLTAHDKGFNMKTVAQWLRGQIAAPVLENLPYGHVQTKVLLPVGAKVDLLVQGRDALLAWGHVA
jgi:muramoyltetrapeptide carboxypeptidase